MKSTTKSKKNKQTNIHKQTHKNSNELYINANIKELCLSLLLYVENTTKIM